MLNKVTTVAMRSFLSGAPKTPILRRIWRHSLATAVVAEVLAPAYLVSKDRAHVAGILHDVGRVALLAAYPERYAELAIHTHANAEAILKCERGQFGLDHSQAGQLLGESWHFPAELQQVVAYHLAVPGEQDLLSLVQTASRLAKNLDYFAVAHQDHYGKPGDTIESCVPQRIRPQVIELTQHLDQRILDPN